jgi:hypothetical protein
MTNLLRGQNDDVEDEAWHSTRFESTDEMPSLERPRFKETEETRLACFRNSEKLKWVIRGQDEVGLKIEI